MGYGYFYKCAKCGHEYSASSGIGMMFPTVYKKTINDIKSGKYGTEKRDIFNSIPYAAVNAEQVVYVCRMCGKWEIGIDVSIYAPNNPEEIPKIQYGIKTVEEWGEVPYVMDYELKRDYHLYRRYYHNCVNCGKRMHKASSAEERNLSCPKCGAENRTEDFYLWD